MRSFRWLLAAIAAMACTTALAAILPINVSNTACGGNDAKGNPGFTYRITWVSAPNVDITHYVNAGASCKLVGNTNNVDKACGAKDKVCPVVCKGACSATLDHCQFGIASWGQVSTADRSLISRRIPAPGPSDKCQK